MRILLNWTLTLGGLLLGLALAPAADAEDQPVSYYRDVRPILQAQCLGCHQPSKAKGGYVMSDFKKLLAGSSLDGVRSEEHTSELQSL